jgi:hypothetical protein
MKKISLTVLTAAALLAAGVAGAAEQASQPAAKSKADPAVQTCKDQGKTGKELKACIHAEHKKEHEAKQGQAHSNKQHASSNQTQDAQPAK